MSRKICYFIILLACYFVTLLITGCKKEKTINMAVEFTAHSACAHISSKMGWFKDAGLNVTSYESYVTGMALAAALARGDIDAAYICLIPAINAYANGGVPIKVVAGIHKYGYGFVVNPDIPDLKNIACAREGSPSDALLQKMNPDIKKVLRMNPPMQFLALKAGKIDAGFICEQYPSMAEEHGFTILHKAEDLWPDMQGSVLVVREELIKEHPETVRKLVNVTKKAIDFINKNPERSAAIAAEKLRMTGEKIFPAKMINTVSNLQITDSSLLNSLSLQLINTIDLDKNEIQKTIDTCREFGYIKKTFDVDDFIDFRFIK